MFLSLSVTIPAQTARSDNKISRGQEGDDQQLIICSYSLVLVDIEVHDGYNWPVSELTYHDFVVFEDGKEQPIQFFRPKEGPNSDAGTQGLYELGYWPPAKDGEFKKVRVRFRDAEVAKNKGLRLIYRPMGYFATFKD